ncbi:MAG: NADH:flavin oxidoreductase [Desulfobacteraceae bacterium 4572_87]|nr:MAG: NADH:flavin oxidoreductase [Desulfobacteraceae bacterium 4572_87]
MEFPHLFSPITIQNMELKNRIVMTAMHLGYTPQGEVTDPLVNFYAERAKGGVGLAIVGGCPIDEFGGMIGMIALHDDRFIPGLTRLTDAVKDHGCKIAAQLYQAGRYTHSAMIGGRKPISASAVRSRLTGETPRALDLEEIPGVQEKFAEAAVRALEAGFDAVEILGSAGYLISQFLSPITNLREDEYGGSFENRMRFGIETILKVRKAIGPDYPILLRIAGNDFMEGSNTNREAKQFAAEAEKAGIDLFNVTGGWHETRVPQLTMNVPRKAYVYLARGIRSAVSKPVISSNRINDPGAAEEVLQSGGADLVTMARGLLADPDLPNKARTGKSRLIYHCVACNQGCFDSIFQGRPATCTVNPRAGREAELEVKPAPKSRKILVVGGGAAGMKVACTAKDRGHHVVLMEKSDKLGGQILLNHLIPGREELETAAIDLIHNLRDKGVETMLGKTATPAIIRQMAPDVVVVAAGAQPAIPKIKGVKTKGNKIKGNKIKGNKGDHVIQAWELLENNTETGENVVVLGGNAVGLETALFLANQGTLSPEALHFLMVNRAETPETLAELLNHGNKQVTVVEMTKKAGSDVGLTTKWVLMGELKRLGVKILTQTEAVGITPEGLQIEDPKGPGFIAADTIVLAAGSKAEDGLVDKLLDPVPEIHVIGDAKKPRNVLTAIREGFQLGLTL